MVRRLWEQENSEICLGGRFIVYKVDGKGNAYKQHIFVKSRVIIFIGKLFSKWGQFSGYDLISPCTK